MMRFAAGRWRITGVSGWRTSTLHTVRTLTFQAKARLSPNTHITSLSMAARGAGGFLRVRPAASWHTTRFYQEDRRHDSERGSSGESFSMKALTQAPKPSLWLGFSGLIPFASAPLLMAATQSFCPTIAFAQMVYGASIVAFLGGARWGFALPAGSPAPPDWKNLGNSVVPSLVAWVALLCRDSFTEGALLVIMGLGLSLHYDLVLLPGYPAWFKAMRTVLTLVATFSLVASLVLKQVCPERKSDIFSRFLGKKAT